MILKLGKRFLCFFDMSLQKNVKSHVFWILKKRKKRILELCPTHHSKMLQDCYSHICLSVYIPVGLRKVNTVKMSIAGKQVKGFRHSRLQTATTDEFTQK